MSIYLIIFVIIVIIILLCYIEQKLNSPIIQFELVGTKKWYTVKKKYKYKNEIYNVELLVYNKKWYTNNKDNLPYEFELYNEKIVPQVTILSRFKNELSESIKKMNNSNPNGPINTTIDCIIPFISSIFDLFSSKKGCNYRILTRNINGLNIIATTDNKNILIY